MSATDRKEMHERIMYLKEQMQAGNVFLPIDKKDDILASFLQVQIAPDGLVDLNSVDSLVRATALAVMAMKERDDIKSSISLNEIQRHYFERIESAYGELYQFMKDNDSDPNSTANWVASQDDRITANIEVARNILAEMNAFWDITSEASWIHGTASDITKGVFGGDVFPTDRFNIAACCGIFFDTIIIPDPLKKMRIMLEAENDRRNVYDFVRFGLKVLAYKDYAVTTLDHPIAAVIPDRLIDDAFYTQFIREEVEADFVAYMQKCLGVDIDNHDEIHRYLSRFSSSSDIVAALVDKSDVVLYANSKADLATQLDDYRIEISDHMQFPNAGTAFASLVIGRLYQANDLLRRSSELRGAPILTAPTSWEWFHRKLKADRPTSRVDSASIQIAHALRAAAEGQISWLGNIPPAALVEMRMSGAVDEIREMLRRSVANLNGAASCDFGTTTDRIVGDFQTALNDHKKKIDELTQKHWKFGGQDIASFVVHGGIAVAAALSQSPIVLVGSALYGLAGPTPKIQDIIRRQREISKERKSEAKTPIGILFELSKRSAT